MLGTGAPTYRAPLPSQRTPRRAGRELSAAAGRSRVLGALQASQASLGAAGCKSLSEPPGPQSCTCPPRSPAGRPRHGVLRSRPFAGPGQLPVRPGLGWARPGGGEGGPVTPGPGRGLLLLQLLLASCAASSHCSPRPPGDVRALLAGPPRRTYLLLPASHVGGLLGVEGVGDAAHHEHVELQPLFPLLLFLL